MNPAFKRIHAVVPTISGVSLVVASYVTFYLGQWLGFLSGMLFAAGIAALLRAPDATLQFARAEPQDGEEECAPDPPDRSLRERLADADSRHGLLLNNVREPVLCVDANQVCRDHNRALAEALGVSGRGIDGRSLREVLGESSYARIRPVVEAALRGERRTVRQTLRDARGAFADYDARYVPLQRGDGRTLGFYVLLTACALEDMDFSALAPREERTPALAAAPSLALH